MLFALNTNLWQRSKQTNCKGKCVLCFPVLRMCILFWLDYSYFEKTDMEHFYFFLTTSAACIPELWKENKKYYISLLSLNYKDFTLILIKR
jgi:hypothetical protein